MSISKKFYSIVLAIVAVFALVGCTLPTAFSRTISEAQADLQAVADRIVFDNVDEVTADLAFPTETQWVDKVTYEWHSSNEAVISNSGKVTRPESGAGNAVVAVKVVITAEYTKLDDGTFKLGTVSTEKEWTFTVLEMPEKLTIQKTLDKIVAGQIQKGDEVSFTGIVVAYNQKIYSNDDGTSDLVLRPYVYDGTGGFFIYAQFNELAVGDEVAVTGTLDAYNGYYQIKSSGISVEVLSKGNAIPEPTKASIAEVIAMNTVEGSLNGANGTIGGRLYNVDAKVVNNGTAEKPEYFLENPLGEGKFEVYYETAYTHVPGHENAKSYAEVLAPYEGKYVNITVCPYNVYDGYISVVFTSLPITEIEKPELTDEQQAAIILNGVSLDEEYREDFELPVVEGVEWEIVSGTGIELVDGVAKVTRTTEDQEVVLKATATYGEAKASKEFTVIIPGKPADPVVPGTQDEIDLTVETLDLPSQAYSAGTVTVSGVAFEYVQLGNYGDGIQMRDKNGNTSLLWNTSAFGKGIARIELTYSSTKDVSHANADAVIFSFGNASGEYTYTTKLSTEVGVKTYTITPDAETYTFFKLEHDLGYSMYWDSIKVVYAEGSQEPVETEVDLTVETLDLPSQAYSAGTVTYAGVAFEYVQLGNYGDGIQMRDKNGNTSLLWNTSAFGKGIARIELTYSSTKDVSHANADAVIFSFGNASGEYTYTTKLSTEVGVKTYTITPDAETYTFFKLEHDLGYSMYWDSIKVVYIDSGNTPEPPVHEHVYGENDKCECGELNPEHKHAYEYGQCLCGAIDEAVVEATISEIVKYVDGVKVIVTGTVIESIYNEKFQDNNVTIKDETGELYCYGLKTLVNVGDKIKVSGTLGSYNGAKQIGMGATAEILEAAPQYIDITVYYKNTENWAAVSTWIWNETENFTGGNWPGAAMTLVEGTESWYSYSFKVLSVEGLQVIFNNTTGSQTSDLPYTGLNYWYGSTAYATMEEADAAHASDNTVWSEWYLRGDMNNWTTSDRLQEDAEGNAWIVADLVAGQTFKVADSGWKKEFNSSHVSHANFGGSGNIEVLVSGKYKLTVTTAGALEITEVVEEPELEEKTYSYEFTATTFKANGTIALNDVNWTLDGNGGYWGFDTSNGRGQQFGSGSKPYKSMTFTSEEFANVSSLTINTCGANSIVGTCNVYVGETLVGTITLTKTSTDYTFELEEVVSGAIRLEYTQTSSKALYIKTITVNYAE